MALDQLSQAANYDDGAGGGGAGVEQQSSSCANRRQQRVRVDLMLSVLYDMLGRYADSDKFLDAAYEVRARGRTR